MTTYIQGGVHNATSKRALKEAVRDIPDMVIFYSTSYGPQWYAPVTELTEGVALQVVGPDPFTSRKWYATITRKGGKLVVS